MPDDLLPYALGALAAILVGLSKTGVPGVSIPAILLMAEAFTGDAKLSVGAILPILLVGDAFAVRYYRQHARWDGLIRLLPYVVEVECDASEDAYPFTTPSGRSRATFFARPTR